MPNLYLTGMMGAGKSVTGRALAALMSYGFIDLDSEIEKKEGRSITAIFSSEGEPYFRDVETCVLKEFSLKERQVFSTGGGIVLRDENVEQMRMTGKVIFLEASLPVLWERVCQNKNRPLLNTSDPRGSLERILEGRGDRYKTTCDFSVMTDGLSPESVARKIMRHLKQ